jgi:hypothetical protein
MRRFLNRVQAWLIPATWAWMTFGLGALEPVLPPPVRSDQELLELLQRTAFDYFWTEANPNNGLVRDRSRTDSKCSIAAVGFGLSAIGIGVERGYIDRRSAAVRVQRTLQTFVQAPQGPQPSGTIGHRGWYYHFLEMDSATRAWNCELSSIDTALLLAGVIDASRFFSHANATEGSIRRDAGTLLARVDWEFMRDGRDTLSMGWHPERGFLARHWVGYNEAMLLYLLGMGVQEKPLPASAWTAWNRGYLWRTNQAQAYIDFPPLFGHQYSHCWVDFRGRTDAWLAPRGISYFENSRRATLAQHSYCMVNPLQHLGYGALEWGLTACDGPDGYAARGAPPAEGDDGTLAPTAVAASLPFAPEICLPTLRSLYDRHGVRMWTRYGFRDAMNNGRNWVADDVLGIDQGPIMLMIENHRSGSVWRRVGGHPVICRGLRRAGFRALGGSRN